MQKKAHKAASKSQPVAEDPRVSMTAEGKARMEELDLEVAIETFVGSIDTARQIYRLFPDLVVAQEYPAQFLQAYKDLNEGHEPDEAGNFGQDILIEKGLLKSPEARRKLYKMTLPELRLEAVNSAGRTATNGDVWSALDRVFASALETTDLKEGEAAKLAVCQRLLREDKGSITPFEEFFSILLLAASREAVTPSGIKMYWEQFVDNWDSAIQDFQDFCRAHPELAKRLLNGEEPEAVTA